MEKDTLLKQAREFIELDVKQLYVDYKETDYQVMKSAIAKEIKRREEWIKSMNMEEGIGCILCGSENIREDYELCKECIEQSKFYNVHI